MIEKRNGLDNIIHLIWCLSDATRKNVRELVDSVLTNSSVNILDVNQVVLHHRWKSNRRLKSMLGTETRLEALGKTHAFFFLSASVLRGKEAYFLALLIFSTSQVTNNTCRDNLCGCVSDWWNDAKSEKSPKMLSFFTLTNHQLTVFRFTSSHSALFLALRLSFFCRLVELRLSGVPFPRRYPHQNTDTEETSQRIVTAHRHTRLMALQSGEHLVGQLLSQLLLSLGCFLSFLYL